MIDWYLSLPRATWKQRLWAGLLTAAFLSTLYHGWGQLHDDLAVARWIAWFMVISAIICLPGCLVVLMLGRAPRSFVSRPGSLTKTLPEIHAEVVHEHEELRKRSREF